MVENPSQIEISAPALAVGKAFTVTITLSFELHPFEVTVTVYVVVELGLTLILAVVAPVLHKYVPFPVAVNVVDEPSQIVTSAPALATGTSLTVTITSSLSCVIPSETVTV